MDKKNKNSFRNEVENSSVSDGAMMERNQRVFLVQLTGRKAMVDADCEHFQAAVARINRCKQMISTMSNCPAKEEAMAFMDEQIEQLVKKIEATSFGDANEMVLDALQKVIGNQQAKLADQDDDVEKQEADSE